MNACHRTNMVANDWIFPFCGWIHVKINLLCKSSIKINLYRYSRQPEVKMDFYKNLIHKLFIPKKKTKINYFSGTYLGPIKETEY